MVIYKNTLNSYKDTNAMSALLEVMQKLEETNQAIVRLESSIKEFPTEQTLLLTAQSLYARQKDLEKDFEEISNIEHLDVCSYRLIAEDRDRFSISALSSALQGFQKMISVVFDSIENGPKTKIQLSPKVKEQSSFYYAYAYPGSLGFVLTVPRERLLSEIFATHMDTAIEATFQVVKAKNDKEIYDLAKKIGIASIRSIYSWAKIHSQYGVSADIQWKREHKIRNKLFVETTELKHLEEMIESTSDDKQEEVTVHNGELVGYDADLKSFHIKSADAKEIKGKISDSFDFGHSYNVPDYYTVKLMRSTKVHYAYEQQEEYWYLLSLEKK